MTTEQVYEILNNHLQSNASELLEGDWTGTMVASRVIPQTSNRNKNKTSNKHVNLRDIRINLSKKTKLSGSGRTELSNNENINNIGITNVEVEQNCLAVAVLANMKMLTNSEQGNMFLANQTKFTDLFARGLNQI